MVSIQILPNKKIKPNEQTKFFHSLWQDTITGFEHVFSAQKFISPEETKYHNKSFWAVEHDHLFRT